ncbi:hypothetical protein JKF63_04094 [Porcisia hertigi]|uniref:Uncharacterized protein n=1 Tax=Porcisia hertigi TaxID=2761500 RepID=A0A836IDR3_9TRYP|nr:hypothetical protein JKF63_04094 [Porcisia hertigi]
MLLRQPLTAVQRSRRAVPLTRPQPAVVFTQHLYSTAHDGGTSEDQAYLRPRHDPSRWSLAGAPKPHNHLRDAPLLKLPCLRRGAAPAKGRRCRSRMSTEVHVMHEAASKERQHRSDLLPPRSSSPQTITTALSARDISPDALDTLQILNVSLALSSALYEDEAAATAVRVDETKALSDCADHTAASPHQVSALTSFCGVAEGEGVATIAEDAYALIDAEDLMSTFEECSDGCGVRQVARAVQHNARVVTEGPSFSSAVLAQPSGAHTSPCSIATTFASPDVPLERKVLKFIGMCSAANAKSQRNPGYCGASSHLPCDGGAGVHVGHRQEDCTTSPDATALSLSTAAALVLPGLDMKAILAHGVLEHLYLQGLSFARCDFSLVRWSHVTLEDCDLSRSIFYRTELDNVVFRRCNFSGCTFKGARCSPSWTATARFEDCDFRLAALGLTCPPHSSTRAGKDAGQRRDIGGSSSPGGPAVCFLRCNFDLSDFQFSQGLDNASSFVKCSNTHLASRFPLRARGGVR